jgi:glycosyltransferase involved in cell wall biosynthesis
MKILWLSNRVLSHEDTGSTGTWLFALSSALKGQKNVQLANITSSNVETIEYNEFDEVNQWIIPIKGIKKNGLPKRSIEKKILTLIKDFNPDIIHVWGTENYWGTITSKLANELPILVEIQGLKREIARHYGGNLTFIEKIKCIGLKELIKRDTIFHRLKNYNRWGKIETMIIKNHRFFSTHSDWAESKVYELNPNCCMFKNERLLRTEFYLSSSWTPQEEPFLFTSTGYSAPFKDLYTLIKAVEQLKKEFPAIKLFVAGALQLSGIRRDGYMNFILKEIKKRNLSDNITWLGPLSGESIIEFLKKSSVSIFPSFSESYGLALAESMAIGSPIVASYNGGYAYLGHDNKSVLFFPPGDASMCAFQIKRILKNKDLAIRLSKNARRLCFQRNAPSKIIKNQIDIYQLIIDKQ